MHVITFLGKCSTTMWWSLKNVFSLSVTLGISTPTMLNNSHAGGGCSKSGTTRVSVSKGNQRNPSALSLEIWRNADH